MSGDAKLLVVDDEAVICQACRRVFSRQGFEVETSTDARQGLAEAVSRDYSAILLDIKMPEMDGIQFLEALRKSKPDIPVMIMTGYPSIPNAASAVRLGASDYITKPFTPEQITQSVRRMLARGPNGHDESAAAVEAPAPREEGYFFFDEAWIQLEIDGSTLIGALIRRDEKAIRRVDLPKEGDTLYQGLPLAGVTFDDNSQKIVPSPISGIVVSVNDKLAADVNKLLADPFGEGWIACVCSTRLEEETGRLACRRVVLMNSNSKTAGYQCVQLAALGCRPVVADSEDTLVSLVEDPEHGVALFDADSLAESGPRLVRRVHAADHSAKVVVLASSDYRWETAYRDQGIFYYAVEPFADNEIIDVLNAAFRRQPRSVLRTTDHRKLPYEPLHAVSITNRNGRKIQLLANPGLLSRYQGLGAAVVERLIAEYLPVKTNSHGVMISPAVVLDAARTCDRVMVLMAKDSGRLPGSLVRDTETEYVSASRENASRATTLLVQPDATGCGFAELDDRTVEALAAHIVSEMMSY